MIEIDQLRVIRAGRPICAVERLSVTPGQRLSIIGTNGSGKTTFLRVLAGLESDFSGGCRVNVNLKGRTYLHQRPYLFRGPVIANVRYGVRARGEKGTQEVASWLNRLGIEHLANRTTGNLSGGEVRRIALARVLICQPKLLLLDEPFADLDPGATETVCGVLNELRDTTVLIASPTALPPELTTSATLKLN